MGLTCKNVSTKDLCKAIRPYFSDLHSLPYNFHSSEDTVWWLSLATEIPAYRFPKFAIFPPEPEAPDDLFVCLHVEKGVDETYARSVGLSKPHIIGLTWAWHGLLADMASNDKLTKAIDQVRMSCGVPMELRFEVKVQMKDASASHRPKGEKLVFEIGDEFVRRPSDSPGKLLASLESCASLAELSVGLKKIPNADYLWIDLMLGVPITMQAADAGCLGAEDIAKKLLAPFEYWVTR